MSDDFVQVAVDGAGKKIDAALVTTAAGIGVERQRVVLGDQTDAAGQAPVTAGGLQVLNPVDAVLLGAILTEMKLHTHFLMQIANSRDDPDALRNDPSFQ